MGMSTHIVGFRPADDRWKEMKQIYEACEKAKIEIPEEVDKFFDGCSPGDSPGREVTLSDALQEWEDENSQGYQVNLAKLPKNVTILRFYNSW